MKSFKDILQQFMLDIRIAWMEFKLDCRVASAAICSFVQGGDITPTGRLYATKISPDGTRHELGLISTKVVTTAGVGYLVDCLQGTVEPENLKYHGSGTGAVAEAVGDTALGTEVESRATGTTVEGASANIFRTVGTVSYTATRAITEHGIFSAVSVGTLLDRSVFAAVNVINGDSIEFTYELTLPAGS